MQFSDMAHIIRRPDFFIPERLVTPEAAFHNRRQFLRALGFAGTGVLASTLAGCSKSDAAPAEQAAANSAAKAVASTNATVVATSKTYPAPRNPQFDPKWKLSKENVAATYNNFYEFSTDKERVHQLTDRFKIDPWPIEMGGLLDKPMSVDAKELVEMFGLEERVYRFRCVEAWAMIVPWTGFPLSKLVEKIAPKSEAKFLKFTTFYRPNEAPGFQRLSVYPWPYTEGLRMDEAMHPLTMVVTGIYGKPLPKQHGAPLRIIVPWKYGYKSIKSIVKIEAVATQPKTLWETLAPDEYPFESNVNPRIPHPRWSQATERMIDSGDRVATQIYNGYAAQVASLYPRVKV